MDDGPLPRRERLALWASSAALGLFVLAQAPGRIVPETKLDVTLDPVGYLGRALFAWDPTGGFGRVQNQAIGYLFPMGAFSATLHGVAVPPWIVQRLWIGLVLAMGLWGAHRVARAVGVSTMTGRLVAAWAYAVAPATLGVAAFQSAGQLPYALAPHVLVPLLRARSGDNPCRVAAASTLWIVAMGGVNGASSFAVLPLVAIWFLTRSPGPARRRLFGWWCLGAVLATLWWLIPLLVSVRYGIRFTDYTESSAVTTITESSTEILRGTGNWLAYLDTQGGRWLPGAWAMAANRVAIIGSIGVAALGLWGLARPKSPGRAWLLPSFVLGAAVMGVGYVGSWGGPFDHVSQALFDGPLAPFRNVHKFAAVVRLPVAIGLGHAVTVLLAQHRATTAPSNRRVPVAATAALLAPLAVLLAVLPAATRLTAPGSFDDVPVAWRQTAAWLRQHAQGGRALLVPASGFGEYDWGRPLDEPVSSLDVDSWAVRDLIPLGGNGSTRLLDGIEAAFERDALPEGFIPVLQRAGVRFLVVRNDLDLSRNPGAPRPATVRRLLETQPGVRLDASFGRLVGDHGDDNRLEPEPGRAATEAFREVDIYRVPGVAYRAGGADPYTARRPYSHISSYPQAGAAVISGGPEALLDVVLGDDQAAVLDVDPGAATLPSRQLIATDTARNRDVEFGAVRDNATYTLTTGQDSPVTGEPPQDRWPADQPVGLTNARLIGAATLTASNRPGELLRPERQPFAAFDDDPATIWAPSREGEHGWLAVRWDRAVAPRTIRVTVPTTTGKRAGTITVETDRGRRTARVGRAAETTVSLPRGSTRNLRITIGSTLDGPDLAPVGFSSVAIDGVRIERPLVAPDVAGGGAQVVSLSRSRQDSFALYRRDEDALLDRTFRYRGTPRAELRGTASAVPGPALDALLASAGRTVRPTDVTASASSRFRDLPALSPSAALDGSTRTAWVSEPEAGAPTLELRWTGTVPIDGLTVTAPDVHLDPVSRVIVRIGAATYERRLDASGRIDIPTTVTDHLTLVFPAERAAAGTPVASRQVAVSEVEIPALLGRTTSRLDRDATATLPCGQGPLVEIDGRTIRTKAEARVADLVDGIGADWQACESVTLSKAQHRLTAAAGDGPLVVSTATVSTKAGHRLPAPRAAQVTSWGRQDRSIRIAAGDASIIATDENANDGWVATMGDRELTPIRVDGWRQGWKVPAGAAGTIELRYRPGGSQRVGLVVGFVAVAVLAALAAFGGRRRPSAAASPDDSAWSPPEERTWSPVALGVTAAVAAACLVTPFALPLLAVLALPALRRRLPLIAGIAVLLAGAIVVAQPGAEIAGTTGTFSGPAQLLSAIAIVAVALSGLAVSPGAGSTRSSRGRFARRGQ